MEPVDASRLAETLAAAGAMALTPHLDTLRQTGSSKIALRVNIDAENVSGVRAEAENNGMEDLDGIIVGKRDSTGIMFVAEMDRNKDRSWGG